MWLVSVFVCSVLKECMYSVGGGSIVVVFVGNFEGNVVGGGVFDFKVVGGEMVEIFGKELYECGLILRVSNWLCVSVVVGGVVVGEGV